MVGAMAPLLSGGTESHPVSTHGLLARSAHSSSHTRPSKVILPQRARTRRSPSGPCATVSGLSARLVMLFLPHICCGRAPARSAARTRSRSPSMLSKEATCLYPSRGRRYVPRLPRASGLARRTCPAAPPTSPAASPLWLPARGPPFPGSQRARRPGRHYPPPLFPPWAEAAARGAQQAH